MGFLELRLVRGVHSRVTTGIFCFWAMFTFQKQEYFVHVKMYYSLGITLAELFDGMYPGDKRKVGQRFGETCAIGYYHVPASLPQHYVSLLKGLLYESVNEDEIREHRFTADDISQWLCVMRRETI